MVEYDNGTVVYQNVHNKKLYNKSAIDERKLYNKIAIQRMFDRRELNIGAFFNLKIPMQKRKVIELANKYGINIKGLTIKIQRNEKLLSLPVTGSTDYKSIGRIDLFPNAFIDEEQLVRTLIHEKCHVNQLKKYGFKYVQDNLSDMEKEAYATEEIEYQKILKKAKK